jgi:hypothetical protein
VAGRSGQDGIADEDDDGDGDLGAPAACRRDDGAGPRLARSSSTIELRIAEEVDCVRRHLEMLGATLAADPILLHRHGTSLQSVDLMNQLLGHLARVIECDDKVAAAQQVSHGDLRSRLLRKSLVAETGRAAAG